MKALELRIGNWILNKDGNSNPDQVTTISIFGGLHKCSHWKPVPLTESWILGFGFKNATGDRYGGYLSPSYGKEECKLRIRKDDKGFSHQTNLLLVRIDYVHQLQNLYYALTGEELVTQKEKKKEEPE